MGTTLIIVEILIIGFQVLAWIVLLLIPLAQLKDLVLQLKELKDWVPLVVILVLALAYTLGVVFDRFIGFCTSRPELQKLLNYFHWNSFRDKISKYQFDHETVLMHHYIIISNPEATVILENFNRQTRLLRATSVNAVLITLIGYFKHVFSWDLGLPLIVVAFAAFRTWIKASNGYKEAIKDLNELIRKKEYDKKSGN